MLIVLGEPRGDNSITFKLVVPSQFLTVWIMDRMKAQRVYAEYQFKNHWYQPSQCCLQKDSRSQGGHWQLTHPVHVHIVHRLPKKFQTLQADPPGRLGPHPQIPMLSMPWSWWAYLMAEGSLTHFRLGRATWVCDRVAYLSLLCSSFSGMACWEFRQCNDGKRGVVWAPVGIGANGCWSMRMMTDMLRRPIEARATTRWVEKWVWQER